MTKPDTNHETAPQESDSQLLIAELQAQREKIKLGGGTRRIEAQHNKGKLTARERITRLLTRGVFRSWMPTLPNVTAILAWINSAIPVIVL